MSFVVTNGTQTFNATAPTITAHAAEASGTGGIIIDNAVTSPSGTSQVYFSVFGSQSCVRTVTGTGIPGGGRIASVTSPTAAVLNGPANSSNAGAAFTVTDTGGRSIQASQALLR